MSETKAKKSSSQKSDNEEKPNVRLIKLKNMDRSEFEKAQSILSDIMLLSRKRGRPKRN